MSAMQRRRLRPNPVPRRAGEPNVLSNQATPNRLSTMGTTGGSIAPAKAGQSKPVVVASAPLQPTLARPTIAPARPAIGRPSPSPGTDDRFERPARRFRAPSLGAIIFIGILLINAARFFGGGSGGSAPGLNTAPPRSTAPPTTQYGTVSFGKSAGDNCDIGQTGTSFSPGVDVWWRADLLQVQAADAAIIVVTFKNARQIDYEYVPPDPSVGKWQVFCAGPAKDELAGTYRIELWNADRSKLLARGEFMRLGPSATPEPGASIVPTATVLKGGKVTFGTGVVGQCSLVGLATTFAGPKDVWWRAELGSRVSVAADAVMLTLRDDVQVDRQILAADPGRGPWTSRCATAPLTQTSVGAYRIEIWDQAHVTEYAVGAFQRTK